MEKSSYSLVWSCSGVVTAWPAAREKFVCWMGRILHDGGGCDPAPAHVNVLKGKEAAVGYSLSRFIRPMWQSAAEEFPYALQITHQ